MLYCIAILLLVMIPLKSFSQSTGELTTDSLVKMGFENVRWTDTPEERVYVVENSAYKIQALGIRKAVDIIQSMGLPKDKSCKLIVTNYNIPQVSLTYQPLAGDTLPLPLLKFTSARTAETQKKHRADAHRRTMKTDKAD